ncbi:MAG: hypothetical protein HY675_21415 [Chloroflexi bacterium]|nr:hypothetical protein [Chloroflexota bacterium]
MRLNVPNRLLVLLAVGLISAALVGAVPTVGQMVSEREDIISQQLLSKETIALAPPVRPRGEQRREGGPRLRDDWFYFLRTAGDPGFTLQEAAAKRALAANSVVDVMRQRRQGLWRHAGQRYVAQVELQQRVVGLRWRRRWPGDRGPD